MIGYHQYKGIERNQQCARPSLTHCSSSSRCRRSLRSQQRTLQAITNLRRASSKAATVAMAKQSASARRISLRAELPRPRCAEVDLQRLQAITQSKDMDPQYLRECLAEQAPITLAGLHSARLPKPTAPLPSFLEVPMTDAISLPALCPTHVLGFVTKIPAGTPKLTMYPIHDLIFVANCASFPLLPASSAATSEGNKGPTVTMPLCLLTIPSPATFPTLQTYLYTKNAPALQSELLPTGWASDVTSILQRAAFVEGVWMNGTAFGIVDQAFWDVIDDSWSQILSALQSSPSS